MNLLIQSVVYSTKILLTTSTKSDRTIGRSKNVLSVMIPRMKKCGRLAFSNDRINVSGEQ
jgi:hypothetical protein